MTVTELEQTRQKAVRQFWWGMGIPTVLGVIIGVICWWSSVFIIFLGIIIGLIVGTVASYKNMNKFKKGFKDIFVLKSLQRFFDNLVYVPEKGLDRSIVANTQMMNMGDRYSSNDFMSGTYKGINVVQADVHIEEEYTDSDGDTEWRTLFMGRWMVFDFNKRFKADIQVRQKHFFNARISKKADVKFKKVLMEDQAFNKEFAVYAQSEHEAFYILTPSLMERIKKLDENISGKILLCFINNKLHVGIHNNKDSFEHSVFKKIDEEKILTEISQDIKLITDFVDELNLDNDLFIRNTI